MKLGELKRLLFLERGKYGIVKCEVEGCDQLAEHAHHVFYRRKKGKKDVKEFDQKENIQLVCENCHMYNGKALTMENKYQFWEKQCARYGKDHMEGWRESLPVRIKHF